MITSARLRGLRLIDKTHPADVGDALPVGAVHYAPALANLICLAAGAWGYRIYEKDDVAVGFMLVGLVGFVVASSL